MTGEPPHPLLARILGPVFDDLPEAIRSCRLVRP
jgi:hypothetical protein